MILQGPSAANVAPPAPAPITAATPTVYVITFDMVAHTYSVSYGTTGGPTRVVTGATPGAIQTVLQNHALRVIETDQGWAASSSSVVTP